jgi:hypothetical protein
MAVLERDVEGDGGFELQWTSDVDVVAGDVDASLLPVFSVALGLLAG